MDEWTIKVLHTTSQHFMSLSLTMLCLWIGHPEFYAFANKQSLCVGRTDWRGGVYPHWGIATGPCETQCGYGVLGAYPPAAIQLRRWRLVHKGIDSHSPILRSSFRNQFYFSPRHQFGTTSHMFFMWRSLTTDSGNSPLLRTLFIFSLPWLTLEFCIIPRQRISTSWPVSVVQLLRIRTEG